MKKYKRFYITLIIILIVLFSFFYINMNFNIKIFKNLSFNVTKLSDEFLIFRNYKSILNENKVLNNMLIDYENNENKISELENELVEFKDLLELRKVYLDYDLIYASVVLKDKLYFQNVLTIDKGLNAGIKSLDAVITKNGLIGIIDEVFDSSSTVKLLNSGNVNISVKVSSGDNFVYGALTGFEDNFYIIEDINNYENVKIGDKVMTTGIGKMPSGILIGYVKEIKQDSYGMSNILYVDNEQNYNDINYVAVVRIKE